MNHLTSEELDFRLLEIHKFRNNCYNQLEDNQKKLYEKKQNRWNVLFNNIQYKKNKQKINKDNLLREKRDSDKDVLIVSSVGLIIGLISYFLSENSISFSFLFLFICIYCIWRINEKNFQSSTEFMTFQTSEISIEQSILQLNLLGIDSRIIQSAIKLQENIDNSYDHVGNIVKNTDEKINMWNSELRINELQMQLIIMKQICSSLQVEDYINSLYLYRQQRLSNLEE